MMRMKNHIPLLHLPRLPCLIQLQIFSCQLRTMLNLCTKTGKSQKLKALILSKCNQPNESNSAKSVDYWNNLCPCNIHGHRCLWNKDREESKAKAFDPEADTINQTRLTEQIQWSTRTTCVYATCKGTDVYGLV